MATWPKAMAVVTALRYGTVDQAKSVSIFTSIFDSLHS